MNNYLSIGVLLLAMSWLSACSNPEKQREDTAKGLKEIQELQRQAEGKIDRAYDLIQTLHHHRNSPLVEQPMKAEKAQGLIDDLETAIDTLWNWAGNMQLPDDRGVSDVDEMRDLIDEQADYVNERLEKGRAVHQDMDAAIEKAKEALK